MSLYNTDQFVREAIDILLKRNAARQANLGTESEPEEREFVKQEWNENLKIIFMHFLIILIIVVKKYF